MPVVAPTILDSQLAPLQLRMQYGIMHAHNVTLPAPVLLLLSLLSHSSTLRGPKAVDV